MDLAVTLRGLSGELEILLIAGETEETMAARMRAEWGDTR